MPRLPRFYFGGRPSLLQFQQSVSLQRQGGLYFLNLAEHEELGWILDAKDVFGPVLPSETFRVSEEENEKQIGEYHTRHQTPKPEAL